MARSLRYLAGPGTYRVDSPYARSGTLPHAASVVFDPRAGRMTITPVNTAMPPLRLDHAVPGGTHPLAAADASSSAILASHGC
ncbi:hypothetical protein ACFYVL_09060 [Streptomyces sp. NPDC004111]|uniref:hypothetical protein n=1 Tax=Streptomyces sp. NPDC004111 TaxID=3364690 RepID=UPI0036A2F007